MKKLNFLKSIVDLTWVLSIFIYPMIIIISVILIINKDLIDIPIKFSGEVLDLSNVWNKIKLLIGIFNFGLMLYALYLFRKLLSRFNNHLIFDMNTVTMLDKIGKIVILVSFIYIFTAILIMIAQDQLIIQIGYRPFLYLCTLGLFFCVLSEVFKIGYQLKTENELTI